MSESSPLTEAQVKFANAIPFRSLSSEPCQLKKATGRVLASTVTANEDSPPYARAIVEGFLVAHEHTQNASDENPVTFKVTGSVQPGDESCPIPSINEGIQVATGSIVPPGPFAIVRMWDAEIGAKEFTIKRPFPPAFFIEEQGCDIKKGATILEAGSILSPTDIGTLASLGINEVDVVKQPKVSVFASGNEVVPFDQTLKPGQIRDCNTPMLSAAIEAAGGLARPQGIMQDDFDAFVAAVKKRLEDDDMVVISGGTAVGGRDFISDLLREVGELIIDGVPMRSGRPLIMGIANGKPLVCVAGHPPEALRGFRLFGIAALNRLQGIDLPLLEDQPQTSN